MEEIMMPRIRDNRMSRIIAAAGACPAPPPAAKNANRDNVLEWAEDLRDVYEAEGKYLSVLAIRLWSPGYIWAFIRDIFAAEYDAENALLIREVRGQAASVAEQTVSAAEPQAKHVNVPASDGGGKKARRELYGIPLSSIIRWMGNLGWTKEAAQSVLTKKGIDIVPHGTITSQLASGKLGDKGPRGPLAKLTKAQEEELKSLYK